MSHFSVTCRLPGTTTPDQFEEKLTALMMPFKQFGFGDQDPPGLEAYLTFRDDEDESRKRYETESSSMLRLADGRMLSRYDESLRNPNYSADYSAVGGAVERFLKPEGSVSVEMPHKDHYATFEAYMADWEGYKQRDPKTGRYGRWKNPNQKWDSWTIGGRWTGHFLVGYESSRDKDNYERCWLCAGTGTRSDANYPPTGKHFARKASNAGHPVIGKGCNACYGTGWELKWSSKLKPVGNFIRVKHLEWDKIAAETDRKFEEFWGQWQEFCDGKDFDPFGGPRERALDLGLVECKDVAELTGAEWKTIPWRNDRPRCDVLKQADKADVKARSLSVFSPISTWAILDSQGGWQEKGEMGWFGSNDATPSTVAQHADRFTAWVLSCGPEDWLICVDCHI